MNPLPRALALSLLAIVFLLPHDGQGAAFLKLGDIKGESTDRDHKDWIHVESFGWSLQPTAGSPTVPAPGTHPHKPFVVTKPVDKASPLVLQLLAEGTPVPLVRLHFVVEDPRPRYFQVLLENVVLGSFEVSMPEEGETPVESFTLDYQAMRWTYTEFDDEGRGSVDHALRWDRLTGEVEPDVLPAGSFRVKGEGRGSSAGAGEFTLRWTGFEEFTYRIHAAGDVAGPYHPIHDHVPQQDGEQEFTVPGIQPWAFYLVEKLPAD